MFPFNLHRTVGDAVELAAKERSSRPRQKTMFLKIYWPSMFGARGAILKVSSGSSTSGKKVPTMCSKKSANVIRGKQLRINPRPTGGFQNRQRELRGLRIEEI